MPQSGETISVTETRCELYVVTSDNLSIADSTDFKDDKLIGPLLSALYPDENAETAKLFAMDAIGPGVQQTLITQQLEPAPVGFNGHAIQFEFGAARPLVAFRERRTAPRIVNSTNPCYSEISVVAVTYVRTSLYRKIGYLFMFRTFDATARPLRVVTHADLIGVRAFPPKSESDFLAAKSELANGFQTTFRGFLEKIEKDHARRR